MAGYECYFLPLEAIQFNMREKNIFTFHHGNARTLFLMPRIIKHRSLYALLFIFRTIILKYTI